MFAKFVEQKYTDALSRLQKATYIARCNAQEKTSVSIKFVKFAPKNTLVPKSPAQEHVLTRHVQVLPIQKKINSTRPTEERS